MMKAFRRFARRNRSPSSDGLQRSQSHPIRAPSSSSSAGSPVKQPGNNSAATGIANSQQVRALIVQLESVVEQAYLKAPKNVRQNSEAQSLLRQVLSLSCLGNELISDNAEIYSALPKILDKCTKGIDAATLIEDEQTCEWAHIIIDIIANYSDSCEFFSRTLASEVQGLIRWILEILSSKAIQQNITTNKPKKEIEDLVSNCLMSLHNITKFPETRAIFKKFDSINAVKFYLTCPSNDILQCLAMIFTARIAEDSESIRLADEFGVATSFVKVLRNAVEDQSGRGYQPGELSAAEIADGMRPLLITDGNKSKFVAEGILPLLEKMLASNHPAEQYASIQCLWTLSFSETERTKIMESEAIIKKLESLTQSKEAEKYIEESKSLRLKASNALFFIENGKSGIHRTTSAFASLPVDITAPRRPSQALDIAPVAPSSAAENNNKDSHATPCVFISYCQKQQSTVIRIREALRAANYDCWIDYEQMHGSTLHCMADGIEKCTIALICYSEDYKKSNNCRVEAEYIFQMRKPIVPVRMQKQYRPDGWLGLIIGVRFYIDMSLASIPFVEGIQKLCAEITNQLHIINKPISTDQGSPDMCSYDKADSSGGEIKEIAAMALASTTSTLPVVVQRRSGEGTKTAAVFAAWTNEEVKRWLQDISLASPVFERLDGPRLLSLYEMKSQAPEAYYSVLSKFLAEGDLHCFLAHLAALDRLWQTAGQ